MAVFSPPMWPGNEASITLASLDEKSLAQASVEVLFWCARLVCSIHIGWV